MACSCADADGKAFFFSGFFFSGFFSTSRSVPEARLSTIMAGRECESVMLDLPPAPAKIEQDHTVNCARV